MLIREKRYCSTCNDGLQTFVYKYIQKTDTMEMICLNCFKFATRERAKSTYSDIVSDVKNYDDELFDMIKRLNES